MFISSQRFLLRVFSCSASSFFCSMVLNLMSCQLSGLQTSSRRPSIPKFRRLCNTFTSSMSITRDTYDVSLQFETCFGRDNHNSTVTWWQCHGKEVVSWKDNSTGERKITNDWHITEEIPTSNEQFLWMVCLNKCDEHLWFVLYKIYSLKPCSHCDANKLKHKS